MAGPLSNMRLTYDKGELGDDGFLGDPMNQFERWFEEVRATDTHEANAMIVSTVDANGRPSARIVLLKEVDCKGFVFYTNYESRKGHELAINQNIALTFYWPSMERQVRVTGVAERVSAEQSDAYFSLRPRGSQLGAIVSPQSAVIPDRTFLTTRLERAIAELDENVPLHRPESWGGYLVRPDTMEFWQGRPDRLHDRIRYHREENGWNIERLAP
jgi:pyridoxamine 5'-phosphate oxidase